MSVEEDQMMEKPSVLGMITNPSLQFNRINQQPKILVPLIIFTIISVGVSLLTLKTFQFDAFATGPEFYQEEADIFIMAMKVFSVVIGLLAPVVSILVPTLIYMLIVTIAKSGAKFKQLFSMMTFAYLIHILSSIWNGVGHFILPNPDPSVIVSSLNTFFHAGGALGTLLNAIDFFAIWHLVLVAIGLQIVGRLSKGLSWGIVIGIYVLVTAFGMMSAGLGEVAI